MTSHSYSLKMAAAAAKVRQQLDEAGHRVQRVNREWQEREHLLSLCIQGHALLMDCRKVCCVFVTAWMLVNSHACNFPSVFNDTYF